jgi:hypothetical protein
VAQRLCQYSTRSRPDRACGSTYQDIRLMSLGFSMTLVFFLSFVLTLWEYQMIQT